MMKLLYGGPRHFLIAGIATALVSCPVVIIHVYVGLSLAMSALLMMLVQLRIEVSYWKSKCELQLDVGLERALQAELPKLLGTRAVRTEKLSDIVQKVVDEAKE